MLGFGLLAVGIALLVAGAVQAFGGVRIFADPPWTVGGGLATIGGTPREKRRSCAAN